MGDRSISCCCCCCCGYTGAGGCGDVDVVGRGCWSINGFPGSPTAQSFSEKEKLIKIKKIFHAELFSNCSLLPLARQIYLLFCIGLRLLRFLSNVRETL